METMIREAAHLKKIDDNNIEIYEDACELAPNPAFAHKPKSWCSYGRPRRRVPKNVVLLTNMLRMKMQSWDSQLNYFTDCVSRVEEETCSQYTIDVNLHTFKQDFLKVFNMHKLLEKQVSQYGSRPLLPARDVEKQVSQYGSRPLLPARGAAWCDRCLSVTLLS